MIPDAISLPVTGAVVGLDVGYSETKASTGLCALSWNGAAVTWVCVNARTDDAHRKATLMSVAPLDQRVLAAGVDGPLVPGLVPHSGTGRVKRY
jgi:hypothetical protein